MSIKNIFLASAAATLIAGSAMAAEPTTLTNAQLDSVNGGIVTLTGTVALTLNGPLLGAGNTQFDSVQTAEFVTIDQQEIGTSVTSNRQAQGIAQTQINSASLIGGGVAFSAGNLTLGGSFSFQQLP